MALAKTVKDLEDDIAKLNIRVDNLTDDVTALRVDFAEFKGEIKGTVKGFLAAQKALPGSDGG